MRTRVKYLYRMPLDLGREAAPGAVPDAGFRLEEGSAENLDRLHRAHPTEVNERKHRILVERVQDPGEDVWVVVDAQGEQCGFACIAWTDHLMRKERHTIRVSPQQALLIDAYILRAHRRRGAHAFAVRRRLEIATGRGRTDVRVAIDRTNTPSQRSFAQLGAVRVGRIVTLRHWHRSVQLERLSPERLRGR